MRTSHCHSLLVLTGITSHRVIISEVFSLPLLNGFKASEVFKSPKAHIYTASRVITSASLVTDQDKIIIKFSDWSSSMWQWLCIQFWYCYHQHLKNSHSSYPLSSYSMQDTPWGKALGPGILAGGYSDPYLTGENTEAHVTQPVWSKDKTWVLFILPPSPITRLLPFSRKRPHKCRPSKDHHVSL